MSAKTLRRIRNWLVGLLLLGVGGALAVKFFPRERNLLAEATRVPTPHQWWYGGEDIPCIFYEWVSNHVILTHEGGIWLNQPFLFDIRTGKKTLLPKLNGLLYRFPDCRPRHPLLSPDRQWVLWTVEFHDSVFLAKLDGSHYQEHKLSGRGNTVGKVSWWSDEEWIGDHFDYQSGKLTEIFTGNRNAPGKMRSLSHQEIAERETQQVYPFPPTLEGLKDKSARWVPKGASLLFSAELLNTNSAIDDTGERLVYLLPIAYSSAYTAWMKHLLPALWSTPETRIEMWTSHVDGTEKRLVGTILKNPTEDDLFLYGPAELRWLPDGKRVSFVYKDALCIISVD